MPILLQRYSNTISYQQLFYLNSDNTIAYIYQYYQLPIPAAFKFYAEQTWRTWKTILKRIYNHNKQEWTFNWNATTIAVSANTHKQQLRDLTMLVDGFKAWALNSEPRRRLERSPAAQRTATTSSTDRCSARWPGSATASRSADDRQYLSMLTRLNDRQQLSTLTRLYNGN